MAKGPPLPGLPRRQSQVPRIRGRTTPRRTFRTVKSPETYPSFAASATPTSSTCGATSPRRAPTNLPNIGPAATASNSRPRRPEGGHLHLLSRSAARHRPRRRASTASWPVADPSSPVYRTRVATDLREMPFRPEAAWPAARYHGQPLPCDEYAKWRESVHGQALLDKGDLSAPTCNNCHGNHGAVPPQVDSVANACGTCHGKIGKLFADTRMKHKFRGGGPARLRHLPRQPRDPATHRRHAGDAGRGRLLALPRARQVRRHARRRTDGKDPPRRPRSTQDGNRPRRRDARPRRAAWAWRSASRNSSCGRPSMP